MDTELLSVSCWLVSCVALGSYTAARDHQTAVATSDNGSGWQRVVNVVAAPGRKRRQPDATLESVSCTAVGCTAVGGYQTKAGGDAPVAVTESGGRWDQPVRVRLPGDAGTGRKLRAALRSVTCLDRRCTAVGVYYAVAAKVLRALVSTRR